MLYRSLMALSACGLAWQGVAVGQSAPATGRGNPDAAWAATPTNLLLNPGFAFHAFEPSRTGAASAFQSGTVACWDQEAYRDAEVYRAPRVKLFRTRFPVDNVVVIHSGKRFSQFVLLAEVGLDPGDRVSLSVFGHQPVPRGLQVAIHLMQVDNAPGEWSPSAFGQDDKRTFAKCARGELTPVRAGSALSDVTGDFELRVEDVEITGAVPDSRGPRTIGLTVEFTNLSRGDVWIYSPCLSRSRRALNRLPEARPLPNGYRHIPRTMQKLWRGEPLHILHLGYSSDAGDGNPPFYLYDEDPQSPTFKQPLQNDFDGAKVGHPEWTDYIWRWPRYFMAMGRLRCALLRKFDVPMNKILLNTLACSGSFMAEAHPAFADYAALAIPPGPANGHREGKTWRELYPEIFARPEGPGPDLVTIGYGKVYCPQGVDEVEQFEGAIRWFQRRYPHAEFILCPNDHLEGFVGNVGAMREISLRYGIPFVDYGRAFHLATRHGGFLQPLSGDAHPQAYMHFLWFKQLERLFEAADPIEPGIPQAHLPERISPFSLGWEGDGRTYTDSDPRIRRGAGFILDDTVVHVWASCKDKKVRVSVDGKPVPEDRCIPRTQRDTRHATFAGGRFSLGDRHIVEVGGTEARMFAVDAKTIPDRQWMGVESPRWSKAEPKTRRGGRLAALQPQPFESQWGAPYGAAQVIVPAGQSVETEVAGTFLSIAYMDRADGGTAHVEVNGKELLRQLTNVAYRTIGGEELMLENRKGIGPLPYGLHSVRVSAVNGPVALLGLFSYDTRPNRANERVLRGTAHPGEIVRFSPPFKATPLVFCTGGLRASPADVSAVQAKFTGDGPGGYEIVGE